MDRLTVGIQKGAWPYNVVWYGIRRLVRTPLRCMGYDCNRTDTSLTDDAMKRYYPWNECNETGYDQTCRVVRNIYNDCRRLE